MLSDVPRTGVKLPSVRITLPDGTIVSDEQPNLNRILSEVLKGEVKLSALPDVRTATVAMRPAMCVPKAYITTNDSNVTTRAKSTLPRAPYPNAEPAAESTENCATNSPP